MRRGHSGGVPSLSPRGGRAPSAGRGTRPSGGPPPSARAPCETPPTGAGPGDRRFHVFSLLPNVYSFFVGSGREYTPEAPEGGANRSEALLEVCHVSTSVEATVSPGGRGSDASPRHAGPARLCRP